MAAGHGRDGSCGGGESGESGGRGGSGSGSTARGTSNALPLQSSTPHGAGVDGTASPSVVAFCIYVITHLEILIRIVQIVHVQQHAALPLGPRAPPATHLPGGAPRPSRL